MSGAELGNPNEADLKKWEATNSLLRDLPRDAVLPPRSEGAYYLPVNYENHCSACHPIATGPVTLKGLDLTLKSVSLPHRLQPDSLKDQLRQRLLSELVEAKLPAAKDPKEKIRDRLDPRVDQIEKLQALNDTVKAFTEQAERQLTLSSFTGDYGGTTCGKCHTMKPDTTVPAYGQPAPASLLVERPTTPAVWFEHSRFNHSAHRAMSCASCHPGKYDRVTDDHGVIRKDVLATSEKVDIPGIDNCKQCHAPAERVRKDGKVVSVGGVRHNCVDCHRYHQGDQPLHGIGSPFRDTPDHRRLGIREMLQGIRTEPSRNEP
ncbi:MAG: cytochrome c3 family protein [Planctomycetes bacterium]|nr:cytochrome c3 family protein [Planctomycetota bacterium]